MSAGFGAGGPSGGSGMSWFWTIIGGIIVGAIIGALARLILPGRQNISALTTVVAGVLAAVIGGLIAQIIGVGDTRGIDWIKLIIQIVLAVVFVSYAAKRFPTNKGHHPAPASGPGSIPPNYGGSISSGPGSSGPGTATGPGTMTGPGTGTMTGMPGSGTPPMPPSPPPTNPPTTNPPA